MHKVRCVVGKRWGMVGVVGKRWSMVGVVGNK